MNRALNISKLAITFFRIIVLFIILCIVITIVIEQIEFTPQPLHIFNNIQQPNPIKIIPANNNNDNNSPSRTVLNLQNNSDQQQQPLTPEMIIYDAKSNDINSEIELQSSRLFTLKNPSQSLYYDYVSWPCVKNKKNITYKQRLHINSRPSVYNITYLHTANTNTNNERHSLCGKQTILQQDINKFITLIDNNFLFEMWLDKLPMFGSIGFKSDANYFLYTHREFEINYNSQHVIISASINHQKTGNNYILLERDNGDLKLNDIDFTYSVIFNKLENEIKRVNDWKSHLIVHGLTNKHKDYYPAIAIYLKDIPIEYFMDINDMDIDTNVAQEEIENDENIEANENDTVIDPGMMLAPAYLPKKQVEFTILSQQELEQNSEEWKMDNIYPEFNDKELLQCGDAKRYYYGNFYKLNEAQLKYYDKIKLWPIPQKFTLYKHNPVIKADIKWMCNCGELLKTNDILNNALKRYNSLIFQHKIDTEIENKYLNEDHGHDKYYFTSIKLVIDDKELTETIPSETMNEWYEIIIPYDNIHCHTIYIHSKSVFGALHGIETLSQLIYYDFDINVYKLQYVGYIMDFPYFEYRGVLLDTSRHFQPVVFIKHFIDSIAFAKYNVFHWHMVDDQSWPFPISGKFEQFDLSDLYNKGCHSKQERYSLNDIKDIIYYANIRGIRVIPEFDVPGHVGSWCKAFDICLNITCHHSTSGVLDPSKPLTFKVVKAVYDEIIKVFHDTYIHIGNDEANYQCFKNNTNLHQWFIDNDIQSIKYSGIRRRKKADGIKINAFTVTKLFEIFEKYEDRVLISWEDLYTKVRSVIPKNVILMVWQSRWQKDVAKMLKSGYKLIITAPFYVDRWYEPLSDRYFADLWPKKTANMDIEKKKNIIGGEACLWAENVDGSVLDAKLWPDAAATIENLWLGPKKIKSLIPLWEYVIKDRLKWYRCFMMQRNIGFMQIDIDKKYPAEEFYLREPMYPFSCMNEVDVRPIEQILPANDTRAAKRAARLAKREAQKVKMNQVQAEAHNHNGNIGNVENKLNAINRGMKELEKSVVRRSNGKGTSVIRWVIGIIGLIFVALILCFLLIYGLMRCTCESCEKDVKDKPF